MSILVALQGPPSRSIIGSVTVAFTVTGAMQRGRSMAGAVTTTLTPSAAITRGRSISGAVTVLFSVNGATVFTGVGPPPSVGGWGDPRLAQLFTKRRPKKRPRFEEAAVVVEVLPDEEEDWEAIVLALLS
jgi:hypothetical protein